MFWWEFCTADIYYTTFDDFVTSHPLSHALGQCDANWSGLILKRCINGSDNSVSSIGDEKIKVLMEMFPQYLVELLLGEPDIILRLLCGSGLVAQLVARLRQNLSPWHHLAALLSPNHSKSLLLFMSACLSPNKQTLTAHSQPLFCRMSGHFTVSQSASRSRSSLRPRPSSRDKLRPC